MTTQTGSISFESVGGFSSHAKNNYATLSQIKGQFATCTTGASTATKVATIVPEDSGWTLYNGATITVKFANANNEANPTLNINNTGAKAIKTYTGGTLDSTAYSWPAGAAMSFTYDGTSWRLQDSDLMERMHDAETGIDQNATSITSFATMNSTYTDPQGNTVENKAKSYVDQTAQGITQSVSSTYATKTELENAASGAEITKSASGERVIVTEDAADLPLLTLAPVVGESVQAGTPMPSEPVPIKSVKLVWNQLSKNSRTTTITHGSLSLSRPDLKTLTLSGTNDTGGDRYLQPSSSFITTAGHKYLVKGQFEGYSSSGSGYATYIAPSSVFGSTSTRIPQGGAIYTCSSSGSYGQVQVLITNGTAIANSVTCFPQIFDLTTMFGAGNEPATVAEFEALFPEDYYPYESGKNCLLVVSEFEGTIIDRTYIDLKGQELHGLDETYRDILTINADRHAVIEKRTGSIELDGSSDELIENMSYRYGVTVPGMKMWTNTGAVDSLILSDHFKPISNSISLSHSDSGCHRRATGTNSQLVFTLGADDPNSVSLFREWLAANPTKAIYALDESSWYTIDLGYVDLPQITDDSTVYVAAEVQPIIGGTWWTKAGYSVGKLMQDSKESQGTLEPPYTEVEWVESNGTQYCYLDWKPDIATWGFEADFIIKNAFSTTVGAWNENTNINGYGNVFGVRNSSSTNDIQLSSYDTNGILRIGGGNIGTAPIMKTDGTRQTVSFIGTTLVKGNGTTQTLTRATETANKYYANMTVFAMHEGLRRSGTGGLIQPGSIRLYSLKFYDGTKIVVDLVGAIRNSDGMTGLYDKAKGHFYPAPNMTYGNTVGMLGEPDTVTQTLAKRKITVLVDNRTANNSRMWYAKIPDLDKLEDGQQITVTTMSNISGSKPELTDLELYWDETRNNSNAPVSVYLKLELANGVITEWIPCYYNQNSRLTSHYNSGVPILLTYREDVLYGATATSAGTPVVRGFWADPNYNTNDLYDQYSSTIIAGLNGVKRYTLCMKDANSNWTSIVNQANNSATTGKTCYTGGLEFGKILYHSTESDYAANANTGQMWQTYVVDLRYSFNGFVNSNATQLQLRKPFYLVGTIDEDDGLFYLDTTKWWTQDSFVTNKIYILVGQAYNSYYQIYLAAHNPTYIWNGTKLVEFTYSRIKKNETDIIQTNEQITLQATETLNSAKTYTNGKIDQEVIDRNAAITTSANSITSTVASTYTTKTEFNNLEIGGRNLIISNNVKGVGFSTGTGLSGTTREFTINTLAAGNGSSLIFDDVFSPGTYTLNYTFTGGATSGQYRVLSSVAYESGFTENSIYKQQLNTSNGYWKNVSVPYTFTLTENTKLGINLINNQNLNIGIVSNLKLEKGNKATDWSPAPEDVQAYTDTQVSSAKSEIKQTTDNITSTVEKINSVKYVNTSYSNPLTTLKGWAAEGHSDSWTITADDSIRVGDTVYIKCQDTTRDCYIYIKVKVTAVSSSTRITGISHGYEDVLPVDTIKSTINQSADSVKIAANHVEINGSTTFKNGNTTTTLGSYLDGAYDPIGAADAVGTIITQTRSWYAECTTAAETAAKAATISPATTEFNNTILTPGTIVLVKFTNTNSAVVANLTLSVNGTTAKSIKYIYNGSYSDIPGAGYIKANQMYTFTYDGTYWIVEMNYNTNSTYNLGNNQVYNNLKVKGNIAAESIAVGNADGYIKAAAGVKFDLSYQIIWITKALTTSSTGADLYAYNYSSIYDRNLATNHGFSGGTAGSVVYLVGTVNGNEITLANTYLTTTPPVNETSPITVYIPIGKLGLQSTGANYFYFECLSTPVLYAYLDGKFRQVTPTEVISEQYIYKQAISGTNTISEYNTWVTSAAECVTGTPPNAATGQTPAWSIKHPTYQTNYPITFIAKQTKRLDGTVTCTTPVKDDSITIIDGGHITTGTIDASQVTVNNINASNISTGTIDANQITINNIDATKITTNKIKASQIDTSTISVSSLSDGSNYATNTSVDDKIDNLEIGGRNLLLGTPRSYDSTIYDAYKLNFNDSLEIGQKYTVQLWDVNVSHTGKTAEQLGIMVYIGGGNANTGVKWQGTSYFTNGHADHLSGTFTYTQALHDSSDGTNKWLVLYNSVPTANGTRSMSVGKWKLEKGDKATDWMPAIEDTDNAIISSAQPNITPYFEVTIANTSYWKELHVRNNSMSNTEGLHAIYDGENGWAHITLDSRSSAGNESKNCYMNMHIAAGKLQSIIKPGGTYTWMIEVKNLTWMGTSNSDKLHVRPSVNDATQDVFNNCDKVFIEDGIAYGTVTAKSSFASITTKDTRGYCYIPTGCYADFDVRISLYEGEYSGPWKPYSGSLLYASHTDVAEALAPIVSKTYTGVTITANDDPSGWLYFGNIKATDYYEPWRIKYTVHAKITTSTDSTQVSTVVIEGAKNAYYTYQTFNTIANTTYRPIYAHVLYTTTQTGFNSGYGHLLGIRFQSAYWGSSFSATDWPREITIEITEMKNCNFTFADSMFLYANASGTGTTNYATRYSFDGTTQGFTETGDRNTVSQTRWQNLIKAAAAITAGRIICGTDSGYRNIAANVQFNLSYPLLYCNATKATNETSDNNFLQINGINITNNGTVTSAAQYKTVYLKGKIDGNTFTISASPFMTCVPPSSADGYIYIPLGIFYNSTTNIYFNSSKDLYAYLDGKFRQVTPTEIVATHRIYYRTTNEISNLAAPTAWIDEATGNVYDTWTTKVPPLASGIDSSVNGYTKYPYLYTCEQRKRLDGTSQCTKVLLDENTTIIDGGSIITNSIAANTIKADSGTFNTANIPNLSAAKITSGDIAAARIQANAVNAINATANKIDAKNINVSAINIGDLAGEIGGRNLLLQTSMPATMASKAITAGSYVTYDIYTMRAQYSELNLTTNDSLTLSFDWTSSNVPSGTVTFKVGTAVSPWEYFGILATLPAGSGSGHVEKTYKVTSTLAAAVSDKLRVRIDSSVAVSANTMSIVFSNVKLEKGTKATDWTAAPEDLDSAIDDASQIASNYIHADSTGINIYDSSLTDSNKYYLRQTAGGTYIYRNSYLKAKYEDTITLYGGSNASGANPKVELSSTQFKMTDSGGIQRLLLDSTNGAIVGKPAAGHAQITDTGMYVYDTNNKKRTDITASGLQVYNASGTSVGLFSDTARIGTASGARTEVTSTGVELYNSSNQKKVSIGTGASYFYGGAGTYPYIEINNSDLDAINIKQSATSYSSITSEGLSIYTTVDDTAKQIAEFGANGATIGLESDTYMEITNNGMRIVDNEENVFASLCKDESQIGVLDATHLTLSDEGIIGYGPQLKPVFTIDLNCGTLNENFYPTIAHSWTWRIPGNAALPSNFLFSGSTSYDIKNATLVSGTWNANGQLITIGGTSTDRDKWSVTGTPIVSSGSNTLQIYLNNDSTFLKIIFKQSVTQTPGISNTDTHIISSLNLVYQYSTKISFSSPIEIEVKRALSEDNRVTLSCKMRILNDGLRAPGGSNLICRFGGHFPKVTRTVQAPAFVLGDSVSDHGKYSTAIGHSLYAPYDYQTVFGKYNNLANYAIVLGNGTDDSNRSCSFLVDWDGSIYSDGHIHASSDILAYDKVSVRESSVTRNTNPTNSQWPNALEICDSRGTVIGYVRGQFINDNYEGVQLETIRTINNTNYYNGVRFEISNTGAYRTSFNQPASVRSGLGLGSLAIKNSATVSWTVKEASVKDSSARSAGANFGINITTGSAGAGWVPVSVVAITHSGWDPVMVSYDMDGLSANGSAVVKTYWHANGALSANSVTYSAQVVYIKDTAS